MLQIQENIQLVPEAGLSEYEINAEGPVEITFDAYARSDIFVRIRNAAEIRITGNVHEYAEVTVLYWNESGTEVVFDENYDVQENAVLKIAYGEVFQGNTRRNSSVLLNGRQAQATVSSAVLTQAEKTFQLNVESCVPDTIGLMNNYSVVLNGGKYRMDATGVIRKGAHRSESHQTSRSLCFDPKMNSQIIPKLIIDDNDVKASHAASVGRVDEEQLYYMQSRGLTEQQCTALISTGYLMPIVNTIENDELKEKLREELEGKIAELCSM
ncbi:MAG: SufD family Fe-S cluster assembly protein [Solobacterium sp.]|nr:SufD family Fe-S cluster assembly protein [Solobacterium sp.]